MHWWSPGAKNNGIPFAKVIILVVLVFSSVCNLEKNEKIMKFRSPYGVTHIGILVIFSDCHSNLKVDIWKIRFFKNRSGAI